MTGGPTDLWNYQEPKDARTERLRYSRTQRLEDRGTKHGRKGVQDRCHEEEVVQSPSRQVAQSSSRWVIQSLGHPVAELSGRPVAQSSGRQVTELSGC